VQVGAKPSCLAQTDEDGVNASSYLVQIGDCGGWRTDSNRRPSRTFDALARGIPLVTTR